MPGHDSRPARRLLEILAAGIAAQTGLDPALALEVAPSALASTSVDEDEAIPLRDAAGREVARIPLAVLEDAYDALDDEEDGKA